MSSIEYFERRNNERLRKEVEELEKMRAQLKNNKRPINLYPLPSLDKPIEETSTTPNSTTHANSTSKNVHLRNGLLAYKQKNMTQLDI